MCARGQHRTAGREHERAVRYTGKLWPIVTAECVLRVRGNERIASARHCRQDAGVGVNREACITGTDRSLGDQCLMRLLDCASDVDRFQQRDLPYPRAPGWCGRRDEVLTPCVPSDGYHDGRAVSQRYRLRNVE